MTLARPPRDLPVDTFSTLPSWAVAGRHATDEDLVFSSGAALAHLHVAMSRDDVPLELVRARLALTAAEACVVLTGRPERRAELRDAVVLLRPGDHPGPAGLIFQQWQRAVARPVSVPALRRAVPEALAPHLPVWLAAAQGGPVRRAAAVLDAVLADHPGQEATALILADAALARGMGWTHPVPLLATGIKPRALRLRGEELTEACHAALIRATITTLPLMADLTRAAARLAEIAPKLRAKGAGAAVEVFLTRDALAPAALKPLMSDRAARRLCDRLVDLGGVRELTGRDTFRIYGV